jgi:hypothetical protein
MSQLLLFQDNNDYANSPRCYVRRALSILLLYKFPQDNSHISVHLKSKHSHPQLNQGNL